MKLATCHPSRKHQARGMCKPCYDKWLKDQKPEYRERQLSNTAAWARKNPEKMRAIQENRKARISRDPVEKQRVKDQKRKNELMRKYGISLEQYKEILKSQNDGCAICGRKAHDKNLHVDHCHESGKVRGLLCHQCNWYLGTIEASSEVLSNLLQYLTRHNSPALRKTSGDNRHVNQQEAQQDRAQFKKPVADNNGYPYGTRIELQGRDTSCDTVQTK